MALITDNTPVVGASTSNGKNRLQNALISGNILFVSKSGLDTGLGNYGTPFLTIQKAIDTHGDPIDAADEKITKVIWVETGQYDETLTFRSAGSMLFICNGPVVIGDGAGDDNASSGTARNITWAVNEDNLFNERPAIHFATVGDMLSSFSDVAFANGWIISGDLVISDVAAGTDSKAQVYLNNVLIQGKVDLSSWGDDRINFYMKGCLVNGIFGDNDEDCHIVLAENCQFDGLINIHKYGRFIDCEIAGGLTLNSSNGAGGINTGVPPAGFINCDISGTITGPASSFLLIDNLTNRYLIDNSATLTTIVKRFQTQNDHRAESYTLAIAAAAITPDLQRGSIVDVTVDENITVNNPTNAFEGAILEIRFTQDATGGFTYTLGAEFAEGTTVKLSDLATTLSKTHRALWERRSSKWELLAINNDL